MPDSQNNPIADFHTPGELLSSARNLLNSGNEMHYRGAMLDALAALESYIQATVFPTLSERLSPDLSQWLENKTKMDFDSRLGILVPFATGIPIDKSSALWSRYKEIRQTRTQVVHGGKKVSYLDAEQVINNVAEWMAYLGSTVEVEKGLVSFKRWVESLPSGEIRTEADALGLVKHFFGKSTAADVEAQDRIRIGRAQYQIDAILKFGTRRVIIEAKFLRSPRSRGIRQEAVAQVEHYMRLTNTDHAAIILFIQKKDEQPHTDLERLSEGRILIVSVYI